ncbi:MAG TPA: PEP/pyruvate-binding domain-containing protein [Bacteroidales bacterium]|nr:PEP/pyruvate-binding domain-containing protein [Bacteroidales bacterium]
MKNIHHAPEDLDRLSYENRERLKELETINKTREILKEEDISYEEALQKIVAILPEGWQFSEQAVARIIFDEQKYLSPYFQESIWVQKQIFETLDHKKGSIEIFYLTKFPDAYEGPFLKEERNLINNIATLIQGYLNGIKGRESSWQTRERLKELACINQTIAILHQGKPIEETLQQIVLILPRAWQYPEFAVARISWGSLQFVTPDFKVTNWSMKQTFETIDATDGSIEIFYTQSFPKMDEGPFLKEERHLIENLAAMIKSHINSIRGKMILDKSTNREIPKIEKSGSETPGRHLLQTFLNKNNYARDVYHDLMMFKVKEILLVANLYDAYSIEKEGRFSEHVLDEYHQLNLSSVPRITGVSSLEEVMEKLSGRHFDLIIFMVGTDKKFPVLASEQVKNAFPYIPVYLLLNNNRDLEYFEEIRKQKHCIDKIFAWNGNSNIFFAMVKHLEDKINIDNDTKVGLVRVILLVEDAPKYYSRYLPLLYNIVMAQTKRIIDDVSTDELYKLLRMRARPKILLASTYEEALTVFNNYKDYLLCLITDVKFSHDGRLDDDAGFKLAGLIREQLHDLPIVIQSSDESNSNVAYKLQASFINKNSETLEQDFRSFITHFLGFGNFIYRDTKGSQIAVAKSLKEFERHLRTIPDESLLYHARRNHFSLWLMARGEIQTARIINPRKVSDFKNPTGLREYLISVIQKFRNEQNKGKIIPFEKSTVLDESNVVYLMPGSFGGKGRGLAFINTLIYNYDFEKHIPNINIKAPKTLVIGAEEFEYFMSRNRLWENNYNQTDDLTIKKMFLQGQLTDTLMKKLRIVLELITKPVAIRSSGMFEDSLSQPFAGIFETYILPNNDPDIDVRMRQATDAVKLVFASVFTKTARDYIRAVNYKIEEEKMAVIIQEAVGNQYEDVFYPHISGVAQSYNFYPVSHMKPEEGFAVIAVGLGKHVVEGEKAYRFSPKYPNVEINSQKDQFKNSQVDFFAVDLKKKNIDLLEGDTAGLKKLGIEEAERHGTLRHCASVYNPENNSITPGLNQYGPRIINFANILKYNYIPLARTIEVVLDIVREAVGSPVEIEFAVDLNKDKDYKASFYLLQIKPLLGDAGDFEVDMKQIDKEKIIIYSDKGMGNGVIDTLTDVIYVDTEAFDKSKTPEMAEEIDQLNNVMLNEGKSYILIGPGRWGTRDRWIGIPVNWPQISRAKVIVETSFEGFPLDASSGSHFFHNVTSMNVGYFTVQPEFSSSFINYDKLSSKQLVTKTKYFRHVRFEKPLLVKMDGRKRIAVITESD